MVLNNKKYSYTEIYELIELMGEYYKNKLPIKVYNFFKENRLESYDKEEIIEKVRKKELSEEALNIYSFLYLKYFCEDELEKNILKQIYLKNNKNKEIIEFDKDYQIFNNKKDFNLIEKPAVIERESVLKKVFKWIKNIFIRKNKI